MNSSQPLHKVMLYALLAYLFCQSMVAPTRSVMDVCQDGWLPTLPILAPEQESHPQQPKIPPHISPDEEPQPYPWQKSEPIERSLPNPDKPPIQPVGPRPCPPGGCSPQSLGAQPAKG